jgi:hypothetical protein
VCGTYGKHFFPACRPGQAGFEFFLLPGRVRAYAERPVRAGACGVIQWPSRKPVGQFRDENVNIPFYRLFLIAMLFNNFEVRRLKNFYEKTEL